MLTVEQQIAEAEFHANGLLSLISAMMTSTPRPDATILRTLAYSLQLTTDRIEILHLMKGLR